MSNWYKKADSETGEELYRALNPDFQEEKSDLLRDKSQEDLTLDEIPEEHKEGDCYEVHAKYVLDEGLKGNKDLVLVHGEVTGQAEIAGIKYGHAWVEKAVEIPDREEFKDFPQMSVVIDMSQGRSIELPSSLYYSLGNINPNKTFQYTYDEVREKIAETGVWGPWDLETQF